MFNMGKSTPLFLTSSFKKQITQTFQREREGEREGHFQKKINDRDEPWSGTQDDMCGQCIGSHSEFKKYMNNHSHISKRERERKREREKVSKKNFFFHCNVERVWENCGFVHTIDW